VRKQRTNWRPEAAKLKTDLDGQAARTRKLDKDLRSMRDELRTQQQRRLTNQLPDGEVVRSYIPARAGTNTTFGSADASSSHKGSVPSSFKRNAFPMRSSPSGGNHRRSRCDRPSPRLNAITDAPATIAAGRRAKTRRPLRPQH